MIHLLIPMLPAIAITAGMIVILLVLQDVFEVLLLPRRVTRRKRLASTILRNLWQFWRHAAMLAGGRFRPIFLSCFGPLSVVILYVIWAICLISAYGFCQWGCTAHAPHALSLPANLYLSGSTFFTLGLGDVTPHTGAAKIFAVAESANGLGLVAAVIGYLPVLYQSFSTREAHVIQLDARAGSPPSAAFLLSQHGSADAMPQLMQYLQSCERWAATLVEGELSFPVLAFYRSHHDNQSWLATLCTIMDACAILLTGIAGADSFQPRMTFALGRMAILESLNIFHIEPVVPRVDRLSPEGFIHLTATLARANLVWQTADAEVKLSQLRSTYEPHFHAISALLFLPLPGWSPSAAPDNWQSGDGGGLAKQLIDSTGPAKDNR